MGIPSLFIAIKLLILSIVILCPKPYDTSSLLIFAEPPAIHSSSVIWQAIAHVVEKLSIWDNVYYTTMAQRGSYYEHEWAFGRLLWYTVRIVADTLVSPIMHIVGSPLPQIFNYAIASIVLSNLSHFLACYMLYFLTRQVFPKNGRKFALITAYSLLVSPAGIFLLAGYGESTFALLTFCGLYLRQIKCHIAAGVCFALSLGIRGNGIFWGIVFVIDLLAELLRAVKSRSLPFKSLLSIILGGAVLGGSFLYIQWLAYTQYCQDRPLSELRPWCSLKLPFIFTFVQKHYWNVGFLQYWTPNNIPNFGFATPTVVIICLSSIWALKLMIKGPVAQSARQSPLNVPSVALTLAPCLIVQLILLFGSILIWHSQIITRIASCLPIINWYIGYLFTSTKLGDIKLAKVIIAYAIIWTCAQAALFACYLPPA